MAILSIRPFGKDKDNIVFPLFCNNEGYELSKEVLFSN